MSGFLTFAERTAWVAMGGWCAWWVGATPAAFKGASSEYWTLCGKAWACSCDYLHPHALTDNLTWRFVYHTISVRLSRDNIFYLPRTERGLTTSHEMNGYALGLAVAMGPVSTGSEYKIQLHWLDRTGLTQSGKCFTWCRFVGVFGSEYAQMSVVGRQWKRFHKVGKELSPLGFDCLLLIERKV